MRKNKVIRSKHNDLLNFLLFEEHELSKEYVDKCKKFFKELENKQKQMEVNNDWTITINTIRVEGDCISTININDNTKDKR